MPATKQLGFQTRLYRESTAVGCAIDSEKEREDRRQERPNTRNKKKKMETIAEEEVAFFDEIAPAQDREQPRQQPGQQDPPRPPTPPPPPPGPDKNRHLCLTCHSMIKLEDGRRTCGCQAYANRMALVMNEVQDRVYLVDRHNEAVSGVQYIRGLEEHPNRGTDPDIRKAAELLRITNTQDPPDETSSEESAEPGSGSDVDAFLDRMDRLAPDTSSEEEDQGSMGLYDCYTPPQLRRAGRRELTRSPQPGPSHQNDDEAEERRYRAALASVLASRATPARRPTTEVNLLDDEGRPVQNSPIGVLQEEAAGPAQMPPSPPPNPPNIPEPMEVPDLPAPMEMPIGEDRTTRSGRVYNPNQAPRE